MALSLFLPDRVYVAGETLRGHVQLDGPLLVEDGVEHVHVKLRGSIHVEITESKTSGTGDHQSTHSDTETRRIPLLQSDLLVWNKQHPQSSQNLKLPFEFFLPSYLPPSFHSSPLSCKGIISYTVRVVAHRPGIFKFNRRIANNFSVVPSASDPHVQLRQALSQGWHGDWKGVVHEDKIRRGIWGDYATIKTQVILPALATYPMSTPVPFRIYITTETKPMKRTDAPEEKNKPIFPIPPSDFSQLAFTLVRHVRFRTNTRHQLRTETVLLLGQTGESPNSAAHLLQVDPPEWVLALGSDDKGKGFWRRTVRMQGTMLLPVPPSTASEVLSWDYAFRLRVPFPGIGNDVQSDCPIAVAPAFEVPPPDYTYRRGTGLRTIRIGERSSTRRGGVTFM